MTRYTHSVHGLGYRASYDVGHREQECVGELANLGVCACWYIEPLVRLQFREQSEFVQNILVNLCNGLEMLKQLVLRRSHY